MRRFEERYYELFGFDSGASWIGIWANEGILVMFEVLGVFVPASRRSSHWVFWDL